MTPIRGDPPASAAPTMPVCSYMPASSRLNRPGTVCQGCTDVLLAPESRGSPAPVLARGSPATGAASLTTMSRSTHTARTKTLRTGKASGVRQRWPSLRIVHQPVLPRSDSRAAGVDWEARCPGASELWPQLHGAVQIVAPVQRVSPRHLDATSAGLANKLANTLKFSSDGE